MSSRSFACALLATFSVASAQTTVVGINYQAAVNTTGTFTSTTDQFLANYTVQALIGFSGLTTYNIDFDATASNLWSIRTSDSRAAILDVPSGQFLSAVPTSLPANSVTGLSAAPDGLTWYASVLHANGLGTDLWVGSPVNGQFQLVGEVSATETFIDISVDRDGQIFGITTTDDSLYEIDPQTGAGTLIGAVGIDLRFAQGMDFDWADNTLWAALFGQTTTTSFSTINLTTGQATLAGPSPQPSELEIAIPTPAPGLNSIGTVYCTPASVNSTGQAATVSATGSLMVSQNDVLILANDLPPQTVGYFLTSMTQGLSMPPGSDGTLCLGGAIGRYNSMIFNSGASGSGSLVVDLTAIPSPTGTVSALPGQTWNFQSWYRDVNLGVSTSNLTDAVSLTYQ